MADDIPGSYATIEPAALPVTISLTIRFPDKVIFAKVCGGMVEFVNRLITSCDAPMAWECATLMRCEI